MYGPVIEGSVFRLRPPRQDDAAVMITWFQDMEVTSRLLMRLPPSLDAEQTWLRDRGTDEHDILWAIEHDGQLIGTTGIHQIDWKSLNATTGTLIGDRRTWGKGIGRELMRIRMDFAFTELTLRKLKSSYVEGNEASRRAQLAAGYREVGRLRQEIFREGRWLDLILTEVLREDWEARRRGDEA